MLAATTPQTLKDVIPPASVGQGFTSRIIFVWGGGRRRKAPIPIWDEGHVMLERNLVHDLKEISKVRGVFQFDTRGLRLYTSHYLDRPEPEDEYEDERLRGYSSRKDVHTLKLAMVLALADGDSLTITETHMAAAIEAIEWVDRGLGNVFSGHGNSATAEDAARIFREIDRETHRSGYCSYREIVKRNYRYLNSQEISVVLTTLVQAGAIEEVIANDPKVGKVGKMYKAIDASFINQAMNKGRKSSYE
jgi:hypothetical protein